MDLRLTTDTHDEWTILVVVGELDLQTSPQLQRALWEAIDQGATHLALDLSDVPFLDSSSLGVIIGGLKRAREVGGDLVLMSIQPSPAKVLALTGLDDVFRVVDDASSLSSS
jgi:anti-sigma B factor antagonist